MRKKAKRVESFRENARYSFKEFRNETRISSKSITSEGLKAFDFFFFSSALLILGSQFQNFRENVIK